MHENDHSRLVDGGLANSRYHFALEFGSFIADCRLQPPLGASIADAG